MGFVLSEGIREDALVFAMELVPESENSSKLLVRSAFEIAPGVPCSHGIRGEIEKSRLGMENGLRVKVRTFRCEICLALDSPIDVQ